MIKIPQTRIIQTLPSNLFLPSDFFTQNWPSIQQFLDLLFLKTPETPLPFINFQALYSKIEQICRNHQEKELFSTLSAYLDQFLTETLEKIDKSNDFLEKTSQFWSAIIINNIPILSGVFRYFESVFLKPVLRLKTFENFLYSRFSLIMIKVPGFQEKVIENTLELIQKERTSQPFSFEILINSWQLIQKVSQELYQSFEPKFLERSQLFFRKEAEKWMTEVFDVQGYVRFVDLKFSMEAEKAKFFRETGTEAALGKVLETELIEKYIEKVLDISGLTILIEKQDIESLEKIYWQMSRINKLEILRKSWSTTLKDITRGLLNSSKDTTLIESLLNLRKDAILIVKEGFQSHRGLRSSVDSAISTALDSNPNKTAELASKEFDLKLRKRGKTPAMMFSDDTTKKELDDLFEIFRYISAKDMFEEFYTRRLVKRLLFGGVCSHELELHILEKLKQECGSSYIKKAEEIFKDVEISKQINTEFFNYRGKNTAIEFYVTVLHSNSWPLANAALPGLIEPFEGMKNLFAEFYLGKQPGTSLSWQFEGSFCEIYGFFKGEKYLLHVSILQAMLLLLFNSSIAAASKKVLTLKEISNLLPFEQEELKKGLYSLYLMKEKVLLKSGSDQKTLNPIDEFKVNENYQSKAKIVKINSVSKKETASEIKETEEKVLHERQYVIDAAIVRILKSKKTIGHNELVNEVFNDLKLPILVIDTKKRIESLIGRDYLVRDKNNTQIYHYVA